MTKLGLMDVLVAPFVAVAAIPLRWVRGYGSEHFPVSVRVLRRMGIFPIRNHYYDPQFVFPKDRSQKVPLERRLPGIEWNRQGQLDLLAQFTYAHELKDLPRHAGPEHGYYLECGMFPPGDAEFWYQLVRSKKPRQIIEIGSGYSTLLARMAIERTSRENPGYKCRHQCVEPYDMPWLAKSGAEIIRSKVEELDTSFFSSLGPDDILFIDSSHVIRPDGDVLFEFLEILPTLAPGVIVHVHDIFSPRNYPADWLENQVLFWNEQYVLEAFLTQNPSWKVIGALNQLRHEQFDALQKVAPFIDGTSEPASFYIQRVG
jgi:hypothetical protein